MTTAPIPHAIQHRDTLLALTVMEAALGILLKIAKPGSKLATRCQTVSRWIEECSPALKVRRLSSGAQRDLDAACESLAAHMMTEGTGPELLRNWSAQYWTGFTMLLDARRRCTDFTVGRPWGWLERTGWGLGYLLMEIATGCDEAGTDIFLEVA